MDKVRLAIVGCGNISQLNTPGYLQHPKCEVVALCDTVRGKAEHRARQWGITPAIYTDYEQVLNDPAVDAVELLTPTFLHVDQILAALQAGKHVSCQKPMCATVPEADRIIAAAAQAGTTFRITSGSRPWCACIPRGWRTSPSQPSNVTRRRWCGAGTRR